MFSHVVPLFGGEGKLRNMSIIVLIIISDIMFARLSKYVPRYILCFMLRTLPVGAQFGSSNVDAFSTVPMDLFFLSGHGLNCTNQ